LNGSDGDWSGAAVEGLVLFVLIALLMGADLVADSLAGTPLVHLVAELAAMAMALTGVWLVGRRIQTVRREAAALGSHLARARAEAERWRSETRSLLQGLAAAIDNQFERWALTPAEREIGFLLLKGLSHKEVADVRRTTERTVRQQALTLYRKAGLSGRTELSAFFLEDLLVPVDRAAEG
jgi:DNA-binding CsgD family transcriptional regulator